MFKTKNIVHLHQLGSLLMLMNIVVMKDELATMDLYPNNPALSTTFFAIAIFLILNALSLSTALNGKE